MIKKHAYAIDEILSDEEHTTDRILRLIEDLRSSAMNQVAVAYKTKNLISKVKNTCRTCNNRLSHDLSHKS